MSYPSQNINQQAPYPPAVFNGAALSYGPPPATQQPHPGHPPPHQHYVPGQPMMVAPPPSNYPMPPGYQPPNYGPPDGPPPAHYPPPAGQYPPPAEFQYPPPGAPIMNQPVANTGWMNVPQGLANCPPGLEYLTMVDQLLVHQKVELLEVLIAFETKNKFTVKNSLGQKVYYAAEDSDCCSRNCCGPLRPFGMKIFDNYQNEVIHLNRPLACESCCFPCCLQTMEVSAPPGNLLGTIEQEWSMFCPSFRICNAAGDVVLRIEGPCCTFSFCGDVEFEIKSPDGATKVGKISKQWSGLLREMFTDADYFGITFPMDLDVKMKAVMLGACFLIDYMFFEKSGNQENDCPGMF